MGYYAAHALKNSNPKPEQEKILKEADRTRLARSTARATEGSRRARKEKKKKSIAEQAKATQKEGETYRGGGFK